jgi:hypothetical protein
LSNFRAERHQKRFFRLSATGHKRTSPKPVFDAVIDDFVRNREQAGRNVQCQRLGGLQMAKT